VSNSTIGIIAKVTNSIPPNETIVASDINCLVACRPSGPSHNQRDWFL